MPTTNGDNGGRLPNGRFARGNRGGPGNPHARQVARLRAVLLESVGEDDLREIAQRLVAQAKAGELPAIRELLDRLLGKPAASIELDVAGHLEPISANEVRELRDELLNEPDFVEWMRQRAMAQDSGSG